MSGRMVEGLLLGVDGVVEEEEKWEMPVTSSEEDMV